MINESGQSATQASGRHVVAISVEDLIYVVVAIGALALRWIGLGQAPLSAGEAGQAIAAWHLIEPTQAPGVGLVGSFLVHVGTIISFTVSSPSAAAARTASAVGGTALVFTPLLFRNRFGRTGTLLFVLILALSPSAVITSRHMTGVGISMLGVVTMVAAVDRYLQTSNKRFGLIAGVALALALLADYGSPAILVMLAAGAALAWLTDEEGSLTRDKVSATLAGFPWSAAAIGLVTTTMVVGTVFYFAPNGLGIVADQFVRFLGGLVARPNDTPYLGLVILTYEPLLLIFGLGGAWLASQSHLVWQRFLAGWGLAAIIISLAYPGALPEHSLWSVAPLAGLTALVLSELLKSVPRTPSWAIMVHAAGTAALIAMLLGSLARQLRAPQVIPLGTAGIAIQFDLILIAMWILLGIILWLTVASIWGREAAWHGFGLGVGAAGLLLALGLAGATAFTRATSPFELYNRSPADPALSLLVDTAKDVGRISGHNPQDATITVEGDPNGTLGWALRDFHNVHFVRNAPPNTQSEMVITPAGANRPDLGSNYVGEGFVIADNWSVSTLDFTQFLVWALYRTADPATVSQDKVVLWVREDIYQLVPKDNATP